MKTPGAYMAVRSRLVALLLVMGIVLSPLRAVAATVPMLIAYDAAVRPTTTTTLGRFDAVRSEAVEAERPAFNDYDGARLAQEDASNPHLAGTVRGCSTGLAQNLANKIGVEVLAPTEKAYIDAAGNFWTTGSWLKFLPGKPLGGP